MKTRLAILLLVFAMAVSSGLADTAPSSVAGRTYVGTITSGSGPAFANYGAYIITLGASTYTILPLTPNLVQQSGTYTFTKTSASVAQIRQTDAATGIVATGTLTFSSDSQMATYSLNGGYAGTQQGYFIQKGTDSRFINVSTRSLVTATAPLIAGFTVEGSAKTVLIRAVGPGLLKYNVTDAIPDPVLEVDSGSTAIASNDNWGGSSTLSAAFNQTGAFTLDPSSKDAAIIVTLPPGGYTAVVHAAPGTQAVGEALVEVYELPSP